MTTDKGDAAAARPSPHGRPGLNRRNIAAAALALIDAGGLGSFSMRKLGTGLGVDPMAVYRHFRDQDELFDGVAQALFEEVDIEALDWDGTWRTVLEQFCRELRDALLRHPHAVPVFATRRTPSWASVDCGVRVARMLQADGFAPARSVHMVLCLREFTTGHALSQAVSRPVGGHLDPHEGHHFEVGLMAMLDGFEGLR